jgi:hypothetical protein
MVAVGNIGQHNYVYAFRRCVFVAQVKVNSKLLILNNFDVRLTLDYKIFLGKNLEGFSARYKCTNLWVSR